MLGIGSKSKSRGRPRRRWLDEVVDVTGLSLQRLKEAARDRKLWRKPIHVVIMGRD